MGTERKPVIKAADMPDDMQQDAVEIAAMVHFAFPKESCGLSNQWFNLRLRHVASGIGQTYIGERHCEIYKERI